ncbi:MAG: hypothetical protein CL931_17650 [Deltaproteobacteria bacterium]|nr:hypothetical protein [Deltaproteobacteria bacterium]
MLIGKKSKKPSLDRIRQIKRVIREALELEDDVTVTVTELTCLEEDCAPIETVFGLLRPNAPQLQHKIHKATNGIEAEDLAAVCAGWGFPIRLGAFDAFTSKEN